MNDAPDLVLITELTTVLFDPDKCSDGSTLLYRLLDMPKHIRAALAKRLLENA
jgi:hypothetical protein